MEKDTIYQLIKHATNQIGEEQLYFVIPAFNDDSVAFEILWKKENTRPWSFSIYNADNWTECSELDILDALEEVECDLEEFSEQITGKILMQVSYMDMRIKEARKLLSDSLVDVSILAYEEFGKSIMETVTGVLNKKTKLSLVKD